MSLLNKTYILEHKGLILFGAFCGIALALMTLYFRSTSMLVTLVPLALLTFPFTPRTPSERLRGAALIGLYLSLFLAYEGRTLLPLAWIGGIGSGVFGAAAVCLRPKPLDRQL